MRFIVSLLLFLCVSDVAADASAAMSAIMSVSAADSLDKLTRRKNKGMISKWLSDTELELERIMIVTKADMNNSGAMKVHLVIVYDATLLAELNGMSAYRYFEMIDQLVRDHPDKLKIYAWDLIAEDRIGAWQKIDTLKDSMTPLAGFIFADYHDNFGVHRARLPNYERLKVVFGKTDFDIIYEDQAYDRDDDDDDDDEDFGEGNITRAVGNLDVGHFVDKDRIGFQKRDSNISAVANSLKDSGIDLSGSVLDVTNKVMDITEKVSDAQVASTNALENTVNQREQARGIVNSATPSVQQMGLDQVKDDNVVVIELHMFL